MRFVGSDTQQISGIGISEFYNVLFDNSKSELYSDISISNEAIFKQGILNNRDFGGNIVFEINANHSSASDNSHVNGLVIKQGNSEFEFPIGDKGYYRVAKISASTDIMNIITSQYHLKNSNNQYPHSSVSGQIDFINDTEYWEVNNDQANTDIMLTLSWDNQTSADKILNADPESIRIVKWDESNQIWVDKGGAVDENTITAPVSDFGVFTLATISEENILQGDIIIYNTLSPNNDGVNDFFFIEGIDQYPENTLKIFNRWGVSVFEIDGYNETNKVFKGYSDNKITVGSNETLPKGTYFYSLNYRYSNDSEIINKSGFLYLNK